MSMYVYININVSAYIHVIVCLCVYGVLFRIYTKGAGIVENLTICI